MRAPVVAGLLVLLATRLTAQEHEMHMTDSAAWRASMHGTAFLQYVRTSGTRSAYQVGSVNRVMVEAGGPWAGGVVRLRTMSSLEPLTLGDRGQPQLAQASFTGGGQTITDHMHPSPWIMELAASYERSVATGIAVSLYGAAIGAPALGPPVYLHRASAEANPAVPLGHHLQDVTHSSFGVVTVGIEADRLRLEVSAFNDRQPEEASTVFFYRGARLDASAARATLQLGQAWSVAGSYGYLPAVTGAGGHSHGAQHRLSVAMVRDVAPWFFTIAYGANDLVGSERAASSLLMESERRWSRDVLFARVEYVQRTAEELSLVGSVSERQDFGSVQLGYARAVLHLRGNQLRFGAYTTLTHVPPQLEPFYGSSIPLTIAVFAQVKR